MALQSDNEQTMPEWIDKLLEDVDTESVQFLREHDENYQEMQKQYLEMQNRYPYIEKLFDDGGEICLSQEEHGIVLEYLQLQLKMEIKERGLLYWFGHRQCCEYLGKVGLLKVPNTAKCENAESR